MPRTRNLTRGLACAALAAILAALLLYGGFPAPYKEAVLAGARANGVRPSLIYAVIKAESNFDPAAVSPAGAKGLAQLTDATARYAAEMGGMEYREGASFNPEFSIRIAARYLRYLLDKYGGDLRCAVAAYNAGEGNVDKWLASEGGMSAIPFGETDRYLRRVRLYDFIYSRLYDLDPAPE